MNVGYEIGINLASAAIGAIIGVSWAYLADRFKYRRHRAFWRFLRGPTVFAVGDLAPDELFPALERSRSPGARPSDSYRGRTARAAGWPTAGRSRHGAGVVSGWSFPDGRKARILLCCGRIRYKRFPRCWRAPGVRGARYAARKGSGTAVTGPGARRHRPFRHREEAARSGRREFRGRAGRAGVPERYAGAGGTAAGGRRRGRGPAADGGPGPGRVTGRRAAGR